MKKCQSFCLIFCLNKRHGLKNEYEAEMNANVLEHARAHTHTHTKTHTHTHTHDPIKHKHTHPPPSCRVFFNAAFLHVLLYIVVH